MEDKTPYGKNEVQKKGAKGLQLWLVKSKDGLFHPLNQPDYDKAAKIPVMEENLFSVKRIRNPKLHRKYFAMINLIFDNQDNYKNVDSFRKIMQMKAGYYTTEVTDKGTIYIPTSIAYEEMDESEFKELFEKVWVELQKFIQIDRETLESELAQFN